MLGQMQDWPLLIHKVIDFAAIQYPRQEIVSRMVEGPIHRTDYRTVRARALKVAQALERDGIVGAIIGKALYDGRLSLDDDPHLGPAPLRAASGYVDGDDGWHDAA